MTNEPHKRRWYQFRLRTLLILVTVFAVPLAWLAQERKKLRELGEWEEAVSKRAHIDYDYNPERVQSSWLQLGDVSIYQVVKLNFSSSKVTDADLANLVELPRLYSLCLHNTQFSDAGMSHLARLTKLQDLELSHTQVTDAGLTHLAGLSKLEYLLLDNTPVTDAGLVHLTGLTNLKSLDLENTRISDAGLIHLASLTKLESLRLYNTQVTEAGRQKLRLALPNTKIIPDP